MVRTGSKHDNRLVCFQSMVEYFSVFGFYVFGIKSLCGKSRLQSRVQLFVAHRKPFAPFGKSIHIVFEVFQEQLSVFEIENRVIQMAVFRTEDRELVFHNSIIGRDNRAVVSICSRLVVLLFVDDKREKDIVNSPIQKVLDVRVNQLCRKTNVLAHYLMKFFLVAFVGRKVAKLHIDVQTREKRLPKREILKHIQHSRNAEGQNRIVRRGIAKHSLQFVGIDVLCFFFFCSGSEDFLTFVSRKVSLAVRKAVFGYKTLVFATLAMKFLGFKIGQTYFFCSDLFL